MRLFLLKGIVRDRSRSLFPFLVIASGVAMTVLLHAWINGVLWDVVRSNAYFETGHVKIMTRAYEKEADLLPNDLAITNLKELLGSLKKEFPKMDWAPRIRFGGFLDIPDEKGETRAQGPCFGIGLELIKKGSLEPHRLNLKKALVRGRLPQKKGEILISDAFAQKLGVKPGEKATLIGSTMHGGMATHNFILSGTVRFGVTAMDRGAIIAELGDVQYALDMEDSAGEVLGFFGADYDPRKADNVLTRFSKKEGGQGEFSPVLKRLRDQNGLGEILDTVNYRITILMTVFIIVMFIVLWNLGLMGSIRRYGEIGVRMALGEERGHIVRSMLWESVLIGAAGSVAGTVLGLAASFYLAYHGVDIGYLVKNSSIIMPDVMRANITPMTYLVGFAPGFIATISGTAVSGIGIYKRQTSQLFKELET